MTERSENVAVSSNERLIERLRKLRDRESTNIPDGQALTEAIELLNAPETLSVAEPEAWLFHLWKPGEHRVYASIDENDNTWWPRDQWKGVTRVPLVIQGDPTLLHGVIPPGELGRGSQKASEGQS